MKTKLSKYTLCGALLAVAIAVGGYSTVNAFRTYSEQTQSSERLMAACDRMYQTVCLNEIQIQTPNETSHQSIERLNDLVEANLQSIRTQSTSPNSPTAPLAEAVLKHIAHRRTHADAMKSALSANQ